MKSNHFLVLSFFVRAAHVNGYYLTTALRQLTYTGTVSAHTLTEQKGKCVLTLRFSICIIKNNVILSCERVIFYSLIIAQYERIGVLCP